MSSYGVMLSITICASRYPNSLYLSIMSCLSSSYFSSMNFLARNIVAHLPFSLVFFMTRLIFLSVKTLLPSITIWCTLTFSFLSMMMSTFTCSFSDAMLRSKMLTSAFLKPFSSKCLLIKSFALLIKLGVIWLPFSKPNLASKSCRSLFLIP